MTSKNFVNFAFYKFATIENKTKTKEDLLAASTRAPSVRGTVLVTPEGINAYFAGLEDDMAFFLTAIREVPGCADVVPKISYSATNPFRKLVIKNKSETIGLGVPDLNPSKVTGHYLKPLEFKKWMDEAPDDFILVDTRNDYEVALGTFDRALNPQISNFKEFPALFTKPAAFIKTSKFVQAAWLRPFLPPAFGKLGILLQSQSIRFRDFTLLKRSAAVVPSALIMTWL